MKNFIILVMTSLIICIANLNAAASTKAMLKVSKLERNQVLLNLDSNTQGMVQVKILDEDGQSIFDEELKILQDQTRKYDLKELAAGYYTFQVDYSGRIEIQKVEKTYNDVSLFGMEETTIFKPTILEKSVGVGVNLLAFTGTFQISVLDSERNVLHTEKHTADGSFNVLYDMTSLEPGTYTCKVSIDDKQYNGSFEKQVAVKADAVVSLW